jgi:hypothetical protein
MEVSHSRQRGLSGVARLARSVYTFQYRVLGRLVSNRLKI